MSATSSFIAGLLAGAAAMLGIFVIWPNSRMVLRRSRRLLLAGGVAAAVLVAVIAAASLTVNSRQAAVAATDSPGTADSPPTLAAPSSAATPAGMPSATMMSQILAMPRAARSQSAAPMDEAAAGLAARLERDGGSAADWSLLAQAYDYLGRSDDARRARARAAQIGAIQRTP